MKKSVIILSIFLLFFASCSAQMENNIDKNIVKSSKKLENNQKVCSFEVRDINKLQSYNNDRLKIDTSYSIINIKNPLKKYKNLQETLKKLNDYLKEKTKNQLLEIDKNADIQDYYDIQNTIRIYNIGEKILSINAFSYESIGGVHPIYQYQGYNFDLETGKLLDIRDILKDKEKFPEIVKDEFEKKYPKDKLTTFEDINTYISKYGFSWNIDQNSIKITFSPYEIAPFSYGTLSVDIEFDKYKDLIKNEYRQEDLKSYIKPINENENVKINDKNLYINQQKNSENIISSYSIEYLDKNIKKEIYAYNQENYIIKDEKNIYLVISSAFENGYGQVDIFKLKDDGIIQLNNSNGYIGNFESYGLGNTNPKYFKIYQRCNILSTYQIYRYYHLKDTDLVAYDKLFYFDSQNSPNNNIKLKLKKNIKVNQVDEDSNIIKKEELKKDTNLEIFRTDKSTFIDLKTENGEIYRFFIDADLNIVNDKKIIIPQDLFDGMFYAG